MRKSTKLLAGVLVVLLIAFGVLFAVKGENLRGLIFERTQEKQVKTPEFVKTTVSLGTVQPNKPSSVYDAGSDNFMGSFQVCTGNDSFDVTRVEWTLISEKGWVKQLSTAKSGGSSVISSPKKVSSETDVANMQLDQFGCKTFDLNVNMGVLMTKGSNSHLVKIRIDKLYSGNWEVKSDDLPLDGQLVNFVNF